MVGENWQGLLSEASELRRSGRIEDAITAYERVLALNPELPDSWYNLGLLRRQVRQFEAALTAYAEALKRGVRDPEQVHLNRAVILSDYLARPDQAERELNAALALNPNYVAALLNLGNLHEDRGNRTQAVAAYQRALDTEPSGAQALARLAAVSHSSDLDEALAERLRRALATPGASAADQADLGFALAGLLDAAGEYEQAFDAAEAANLASRTATGAHYDRRRAEQFIDQLIAGFHAPVPAPGPHPSPLFICGMFRSGSTLVEQILGCHSEVRPAGELDLVPQLAARIRGYPQALAGAPPESWREFYLRGLPTKPAPDILVTDKRPENFLHIGLIKTIFPSAKILHTRRNRLDNLLSLYLLHLDPAMAYALDLEDADHWYGQYRRLMAHWKTLYPGDILDTDYDELVREPDPVLKRLLEFLELEWEDGLLEFHQTGEPVKTASVWQVRQPLHARSSGRWRNYSKQIQKLIEG